MNNLHTVVYFQAFLFNTINFQIDLFYFANGPGDWDSILGRFLPKTQKIVFDAFLLNT